MSAQQRQRRPRRAGRANSDAERRALAKANRTSRAVPQRPGFATLNVDGGARTGPPAAATGFVLTDVDGTLLAKRGEPIGVASATVAEYRALLSGLRSAHEAGLDRVDARTDCRLLASHLNNECRPSNPKLNALADEISELRARIGTVTVTWIPAGANGAAHALVADALGGRA